MIEKDDLRGALTFCRQGEYVDMIRAGSSNIAVSVTKDFQPFFKKKWLGIF